LSVSFNICEIQEPIVTTYYSQSLKSMDTEFAP
jgi:hypothetical protein